jgi:hypothetical protein
VRSTSCHGALNHVLVPIDSLGQRIVDSSADATQNCDEMLSRVASSETAPVRALVLGPREYVSSCPVIEVDGLGSVRVTRLT